MAELDIGFIGGGMMATALIGGLVKAGMAKPSNISVSDSYAPMLEKHKAAGYNATPDNKEVVKAAKVIFIAVKPDIVKPVLAEIKDLVSAEHLIVSIAAGVSLAVLEGSLNPGAKVIRVMPNTPALVQEGASAWSKGSACAKDDGLLVASLLDCCGKSEEVPEKLMDAVTGLSGSGPAYIFLLIEALADGGVRAGLPRSVAMTLAAQTVRGSATMVLETGKHPGELKDQVCSPGGTTIAGVEALERGGFRAAAMGAVTASAGRSEELKAKAAAGK